MEINDLFYEKSRSSLTRDSRTTVSKNIEIISLRKASFFSEV